MIDTTIPVSNVTYNGEAMPLASAIEVVQTTGTSETAVMSQKAVTDALNSLDNTRASKEALEQLIGDFEYAIETEILQPLGQIDTRVTALESAGGGSGGSGGGVVLKSVNIGTTPSQWYSGIKSLINKGVRDIKVTMGVSNESAYVPVDRHMVALSTMEHTFDSTSYAAFTSGITYVFSVTAYTSAEIHLFCRIFDSSSPREIGLCVTSSDIDIQLTTHGINTYNHKETFYHGYSSLSSMPGVGTAYYYDTE